MIKPLSDKIVVKPFDADTETSGGILLPTSAQEKPVKAKVIAIGRGKNGLPVECAVGDTVIYTKGAGVPFENEGENYLIMIEDSILAIL